MLIFISLAAFYGVQTLREILVAAIMTRRAEALAFSRRVIPRTGKTKTVIPPHKSGEGRDIFNVFHYF